MIGSVISSAEFKLSSGINIEFNDFCFLLRVEFQALTLPKFNWDNQGYWDLLQLRLDLRLILRFTSKF